MISKNFGKNQDRRIRTTNDDLTKYYNTTRVKAACSYISVLLTIQIKN